MSQPYRPISSVSENLQDEKLMAGHVREGTSMNTESSGAYRFTVNEVTKVPGPFKLAELMMVCWKCGNVPDFISCSCSAGHVTCLGCGPKDLSCEHEKAKVDNAIAASSSAASKKCGRKVSSSYCHAFTRVLRSTKVVCPRCDEVVSGHRIWDHDRRFCLENLQCCFAKCYSTKRFTKKALVQHLTKDHCVTLYGERDHYYGRVIHIISESVHFRQMDPWAVAFLMEFDNTHFICLYGWKRVDGINSFVVIVYYMLSKDNGSSSKTYRGTISMKAGHTYTGMFSNIIDTIEDVVDSYRCLVVPAKMCLTPGGHAIRVVVEEGVGGS